jgi:hypothetical protein
VVELGHLFDDNDRPTVPVGHDARSDLMRRRTPITSAAWRIASKVPVM